MILGSVRDMDDYMSRDYQFQFRDSLVADSFEGRDEVARYY